MGKTIQRKHKKRGKEKMVREFNYNSMIGAKIDGEEIKRIVTTEYSDYIDIYCEKTNHIGISKEEVYKWIHQR